MSAKITKKEVQHMAELAYMHIDEREAEKLQKDIESILEYMDILDREDVGNLPPTAYTIDIINRVRQDGEELDCSRELLQNISQETYLDQAPEREGELFRTNSVFGSGEKK